jgi:hypothetical protein
MGKLHQFALFWRAQQARTFTSFHFSVPTGERARERAQKFVSLFEQLTTLQIYGAVVDELPLTVDLSTPPPPTGTNIRLEINLYPDAILSQLLQTYI